MKKAQAKVYIFIHNDGAMYGTALLSTSWRGGRPCRNADMKAKHEEEQMRRFFSSELSLWLTAVGGKAMSQSPHRESARQSRRRRSSREGQGERRVGGHGDETTPRIEEQACSYQENDGIDSVAHSSMQSGVSLQDSQALRLWHRSTSFE
jgi:hypothetical protein